MSARLRPSPRIRRWFALVLVLTPIVFFLMIEVGLRIADYGEEIPQWIQTAPGKLMLNTDIGRRYFRTVRVIPMSNQDVFDIEKKPDAFRIFVLGESSGAGYPFAPIGSFSRWLRTRLEIVYPSCTIEVVNLSMTAINSYTLRDLFAGVLEQRPDLVLIYAGHNEYYGAFGVGSSESAGAHRWLVRLSLYLERFRSYQLIRNALATVGEKISGPARAQDGTLMSRMALDQAIPLGSDTFHRGLRQYEENVRDILDQAGKQGVPVVLGTLVNNLRDQRPFISSSTLDTSSADQVYRKAVNVLASGRPHEADSLFRLAKDLDLLRFRAPEAMNDLIVRLGIEFSAPVVNMDSVFRMHSPAGIIGDNLMTDHLHPTLEGYQLMGAAYFDKMRAHHFLPTCRAKKMNADTLEMLTKRSFPISRLDSVLGRYRIALLKNDWPYVSRFERRPTSDVLHPSDEVERAAYRVVTDEESWESAHRGIASWHLSRNDIEAFRWEMGVLISQFPVIVEYYDYTANELMKAGRYDQAFDLLFRRQAIQPSPYAAKWLGIIHLSRGEVTESITMLEESLRSGRTDPQTLYNLAGAYALAKDFIKARPLIEECLKIDSEFPQAAELRQQLIRATGS